MEYYSAIKRNEIGSLAETWMDLDCHTEWGKSEREKQTYYEIAYLWNLGKNTDEMICKAEIETHQ